MGNIEENYEKVKSSIPQDVVLVAVSKTYSAEKIKKVYDLNQRDFGENRVQELLEKQAQLPHDIRWHFIGHLQTNKVKSVLPYAYLIHSVDRLKLIQKIQKEAEALDRQIRVLLQVKIAQEDSKYGLSQNDLEQILQLYSENVFPNVKIEGIMGMATFTNNEEILKKEFTELKNVFDQYSKKYGFSVLSMGMSADYELAIQEGSTMVRIGSSIFGERH